VLDSNLSLKPVLTRFNKALHGFRRSRCFSMFSSIPVRAKHVRSEEPNMRSMLFRLVLVAFAMCPAVLFAQDTASITGTVTDPSGAAVASAQVTLTSPEKGVTRSAAANASGDYLFAALPIGAYDMSVSAPGFKKYEAKGIVLNVGEKARNDIHLQVGAAQELVNVEGTNVAQVETQSSDLAGTVTGKEISQLQLNGRVFTQLVTLVPGVSNQTGSSEGQVGITANVNYSINGGRLEYNNWELDGGDNMDNGSNATLNVSPSIDAIAEFKVLTSNYGAQYGRNGSGTIETETKSGTSSFHGDVYEFVRNDKFNATPEFQSSVPSYKKNDWGYTIGGPVYIPGVYNTNKQKTFFFFSEEWRRDRVPGQNFNQTVPSTAERSGDFSDLCLPTPTPDCPTDPRTGTLFDGSQGPLPVDPNAAALLAMIPSPSSGSTNVYTAAPSQPTNWREELVRVDHNLNDKMRIMFRYAHDSWQTVTATPLWTNAGSFPTVETNFVGPAQSLVARLTATASPTLLNEFVFRYTTDHIVLTSTGTPDPNAWKRTSAVTIGSLFPSTDNGGKLPGFSVTGGAGGAYGSDGFGQDPGYIPNGPYNSNPTYTYRDNVTKIVGKHNLQFGAYAVFAQKNELSATEPSTNGFLSFDNSAPVSSGNPFADLLLGNVASFGQASAQPKYYNRYKILEPYFQDDFHATKKLTLNLGIRLSLFGTYRERYKNAFNFDPAAWKAANAPLVDDFNGDLTGQGGAIVPNTGDPFNGMVQCGTGGVPVGCMKGHLFNPAPRLGFAYDPKGDGKMAIRGGYGIFFEHTNGNESNTEALEGSPPLVNAPTQYNIAGYTSIGSQAGLLFPLNVISIPSKAIWPYVQQWHFDVQSEVAKNTVATVSYVGSKGTHLGRKFELNQLHPLPASQNPYIALGTPIDSNNDCGSVSETISGSGQVVPSATVNGQAVSQQVATSLTVACSNDANPFRPFRGFGDISRLDNGSSSVYHALQTSLRRSVGALQVNFSYTYSHSIDDASDGGLFGDGGILNAYNFRTFRASSNFDQRHLVSASYIYDLPLFKNSGLLNKVLGGWQYSGIVAWQTGTPFSVYNGADTPDNAGLGNGVASNAGAGQSYADVTSDPHQNVPRFSPLNGFGPFVANPNAFASPIGLTLGDSGRNFLRNPGHWNVDMALYKHFAITERVGFEFRAEAFNVFNHVEYGPLGGDQGGAAGSGGFSSGTSSFVQGPYSIAGAPDSQNIGAPPFLQKGTAYSPRIIQLGAKLIF
jgi:Carboxypeptidase regulatory-like domain